MLSHGKIAWQSHFAKEKCQQQQQAHPGADILGTSHPTPLPVQPLPSPIAFDDHSNPMTDNWRLFNKSVARAKLAAFFNSLLIPDPASPLAPDTRRRFRVLLRCEATDC